MKIVLGTIASLILTGTASAASWNATDDKGLKIYNLDAGALQLTLVCDPEGAYIPPLGHLLVYVGGRELESGLLEVAARGSEFVPLKIHNGTVLARENGAHWEQATNVLFAGGAVALKAGGKQDLINLNSLGANTCLK